MIQIRPGDLVAIEHGGRFYYAIVLSKLFMVGAQLVYAFHRTTQTLETCQSVLSSDSEGFHYLVDFVIAKRRGCIHRIARNLSTADLTSFRYYRQDGPTYGLNRTWAIWDREAKLVSTPAELTDEQWSYPVLKACQYGRLCQAIDGRWKPEHDRALEREFQTLLLDLRASLSHIATIRTKGDGDVTIQPDRMDKQVNVFLSRELSEAELARATRKALKEVSPGWEIWFTRDGPPSDSFVVTATSERHER